MSVKIRKTNTYITQDTEIIKKDFLVRFFDYDGTILKEQWVYSGETATAPTVPTHQYLTFSEWNNTFTNVTEDIDTGALYDTTDGKTYLFITLTASMSGTTPTLYFKKFTTDLMTIDWGDGTTSTSTDNTSSGTNITHSYSSYGNYIITVDNPIGTYYFGDSSTNIQIFGTGVYRGCLTKVYLGNNVTITSSYFLNYTSLKNITIQNSTSLAGSSSSTFNGCNNLVAFVSPTNLLLRTSMFLNCVNLKYIIFPPTFTSSTFIDSLAGCVNREYTVMKNTTATIGSGQFNTNYTVSKQIIPSMVTSIGNTAYQNNYSCCCYLCYPITPPTLVSTTVFNNINSLAKIYVPDAVVNTYKTASGWIAYTDYIYPLSTYVI